MYDYPTNSFQVSCNTIEEWFYDGGLEYLYNAWRDTEHRVNCCQAWFVTTPAHMILKSYNTIVAVYDMKTGVLFSIGRFSSTTYQHIRKFRNNYCPKMHLTEEHNLELVNWYK